MYTIITREGIIFLTVRHLRSAQLTPNKHEVLLINYHIVEYLHLILVRCSEAKI